MEHFNIFHWKNCSEWLKEFDAVGVEWLGAGARFGNRIIPYGHFSGNYWWRKAEYIRKLQDV